MFLIGQGVSYKTCFWSVKVSPTRHVSDRSRCLLQDMFLIGQGVSYKTCFWSVKVSYTRHVSDRSRCLIQDMFLIGQGVSYKTCFWSVKVSHTRHVSDRLKDRPWDSKMSRFRSELDIHLSVGKLFIFIFSFFAHILFTKHWRSYQKSMF